MRYFLDTEFDDKGRTIDLISIGIVSEDGRKYYAESNEFNPDACNAWVKENVLTKLTGPSKSRAEIRDGIKAFIAGGSNPIFWGYYADYDWVLFCQLFGGMLNLPMGWPQMCMDVKQYAIQISCPNITKFVPPPDNAHNSLDDAIWTCDMYDFLVKNDN
jgi:hypothetical protein